MMAEGIFRVKETLGGYRHYIELDDGDHDDIHCGSALDVQLGRWEEVPGGEELVPDRWVAGRYEGDLCGCENSEDAKGFLYLGYLYPGGAGLVCKIPLGVRVRRPER